jgi:CheY-like chemotaxis protein
MIALSSDAEPTADISSAFAITLIKPFKDEQLLKSLIAVLDSKRDEKDSPPSTPKTDMAVVAPSRRRTQHMIKPLDPPATPDRNIDVNILIAEDHVFNQQVLIKMLNGLGYYNIDVANNGDEVVKMVKKNKGKAIRKEHHKFLEKSAYDIIFMDIIMPGMDGVEASLKIDKLFKKREHRPKIIAVTANAMPGDSERYLTEGKMDSYIAKPIENKQQLVEALRDI